MSLPRRTVALLLALAFLGLSTFGAGWVVCAGADGHVAVESLTAGCCGDGHDRGDDDRPRDDDCGDCADVLLANLTPTRLDDHRSPDVAPAAVLVASVPAFTPAARALATGRTPRGPPRPPPLARHLETTVLRL